jgi:hypothetical protein
VHLDARPKYNSVKMEIKFKLKNRRKCEFFDMVAQ